MFDAYTVKKVMPRLVIAAILIQLSWPLFTLMLEATNQIAWGVEGLLYAPFGGRAELDIGVTLEKVAGTREFLVALAGGAAWVAIGAPGVLALAIGIVLALLVAFFVLAIRQTLIVVMLVTAPIALVAWILPNTEGIWKLWWGTFTKALMMYPLILLIIAGGRIAAWMVGESGIDGALGTVMVMFVFFAPFFLIGKTFQFAGGAIGMAGGALSGRTSGITKGLNKRSMAKQSAKWGERRTRADESRLFNPEGRLRRFNNLASTMVNPKAAAQIALRTKSGASILSSIGQSKWDSTEKFAGVVSKAGMNDRALNALTYWDGTKNGVEQLAQNLERVRYDDDGKEIQPDANDILGAQQLRQNAGMLYGTYKSEEYGRADVRGAAGLALASQGFTSGDQIARVANDIDSRNEGLGIGNMFKTSAELAGARAGALTKPGYSVTVGADGKWQGSDYNEKGAAFKQVSKIGVQDIGASKGLFEKSYIDHSANNGQGEKVKTKTSVGQAMVKTLQNGGADAQELQGTLLTAYNSYNNPAIRADIRKVIEGAGGDLDSMLGRGGGDINHAEAARANEPPQQPPGPGQAGDGSPS